MSSTPTKLTIPVAELRAGHVIVLTGGLQPRSHGGPSMRITIKLSADPRLRVYRTRVPTRNGGTRRGTRQGYRCHGILIDTSQPVEAQNHQPIEVDLPLGMNVELSTPERTPS